MRVQVIGDRAARTKLNRASRELSDLSTPTARAANAIARTAATLAAKRTGRLSRGNRVRSAANTAQVSNSIRYAPYVEYGTRYMRAQPYLRPALHLTDITDFYTDHADRVISRI